MHALSRRALLGGLLALTATPAARASGGGGGKGGETFVKLPSIVLEYWDEDGLFHAVNMDLTAVFPAQASVNKKVSQEITRVLSAMTWEEFSRGNPAATIKAVALDAVRKDPTGANCSEVLVIKLMMR
ncbi:MAG: hypothetical protein ACM31D_20720 [Bacteroidota bacterium]